MDFLAQNKSKVVVAMIGLFETTGANGEKEVSSKRVVGVAMCAIGILLMVALGVVSFFTSAADAGTVQTAAGWLLGVGGGLLGVGVFEHVGKK